MEKTNERGSSLQNDVHNSTVVYFVQLSLSRVERCFFKHVYGTEFYKGLIIVLWPFCDFGIAVTPTLKVLNELGCSSVVPV